MSSAEEDEEEEEDDEDEDYYDWDILEDRWTDYQEEEMEETSATEESEDMDVFSLSELEKQDLAMEIVQESITQQWQGVIGGVQALD